MQTTAEFLAAHRAFENAALANRLRRNAAASALLALAMDGKPLGEPSFLAIEDALELADNILGSDPSDSVAEAVERAQAALIKVGGEG